MDVEDGYCIPCFILKGFDCKLENNNSNICYQHFQENINIGKKSIPSNPLNEDIEQKQHKRRRVNNHTQNNKDDDRIIIIM